MATVETVIYM